VVTRVTEPFDVISTCARRPWRSPDRVAELRLWVIPSGASTAADCRHAQPTIAGVAAAHATTTTPRA
jgi:hypothetical protein